jgi:predicted dithiol-disulfide oxidoreductase (DUF899 family)/catechol 2,3-dioxygenase-like lactoylglutathione lyase family enzyme
MSSPTQRNEVLNLPPVVSSDKWRAAHEKLLAKEKEITKALDALAAERRRQPMVRVEHDYAFAGPQEEADLLDLFEGRRQLIVYHFMYEPGAPGWPSAGCDGCSMFVDNIGDLAHLHARDTTFALVSRAPLEKLTAYKRRMGWTIPWYSIAGRDFSADFDVPEGFGLNVFLRDGDSVFRTYFTTARGVERLGSIWTFLDLTPLGRQETWEDSPPGRPQGPPYEWWRRHDEYDDNTRSAPGLKAGAVATRLPAQDLERARAFYAEKVGLEPSDERPGGLLYRCAHGEFALFASAGGPSGTHTQMAWEVEDIESTVAELGARGLVFEEYDFPGLKTVDGIADVAGNYPSKGAVGERAAWFRDSEGNLIGIGEPVYRTGPGRLGVG